MSDFVPRRSFTSVFGGTPRSSITEAAAQPRLSIHDEMNSSFGAEEGDNSVNIEQTTTSSSRPVSIPFGNSVISNLFGVAGVTGGETTGKSISKCMSLTDILGELESIMNAAKSGEPYDEKRIDFLIKAQEENPEYQSLIAAEYELWKTSINPYITECLNITRSYISPTIFTSTSDTLLELGISSDISKRILQKQCLWLVRMGHEEIARLHEADLNNRYAVTSQMLDIVELSAIYAALPERFVNDQMGKKIEWRDQIESSLKKMLIEKENGTLPKGKIRAPCYNSDSEYGPISDLISVRNVEIISGSNPHTGPRRSFQEVCKRHSLFNRNKNRRHSTQEITAQELKDIANEREIIMNSKSNSEI